MQYVQEQREANMYLYVICNAPQMIRLQKTIIFLPLSIQFECQSDIDERIKPSGWETQKNYDYFVESHRK